jgi:WD40 repeat protein
VNHVLLTQDGRTAVTLSKDGTARVWDAATGACLHVLAGE